MFRELFIAPMHMRAALRRCEHEGTPLRMRKRIEKPGDRRAVTRPSRPRAPRADPPSRTPRAGSISDLRTPQARPPTARVRLRAQPALEGPLEIRKLCGDCDQTSQHVPQMQIRCPRVPGMRFGFMLNKRSQRNYRGAVLLRSHYRCGTLFSGTNHYHSKLARSTRMSHSRSHIGILRRLIRVYIGYPTDIRIT